MQDSYKYKYGKHLGSDLQDRLPVLVLESIVGRATRLFLRRIFFFVSIIFFFAYIGAKSEGVTDSMSGPLGILLLAFALLLSVSEAMHNSFYFRRDALPFEIFEILYKSKGRNMAKELFQGKLGKELIMRIGLRESDRNEFISKYLSEDVYFDMREDIGTAEEFGRKLVEFDKYLKQFIFAHGVSDTDFARAISWVIRIKRTVREAKRWWGEENVRHIKGVGESWSYGQTYELSRYGRFIDTDKSMRTVSEKRQMYMGDVSSIERVLLKRQGANVLLVASETQEAFDTVLAFAGSIEAGESALEFEDYRLFVVDGKAVVEDFSQKIGIEMGLARILGEAERVGNIIVVFDNLPGFAESAKALGVDITALLDQYLRSHSLRIIALSDKAGFHSVLESHKSLLAHFEHMDIHGTGGDSLLSILEDAVLPFEHKYHFKFSVGAIGAIVKSAERFYAEKSLDDACFDLLYELVPDLVHKGKRFVTADDVHLLSEEKTGIPQTEAGEGEKKKLLSLEETLHKRIVGQDEAVNAISTALRRARAGVRDEKRPIGSFLFIGPTGVGKTETTKALAESFFGSENAILRLDMSEYATADAVDKLIGSYSDATPGVFSSRLRERPYTVILLDEFEKTSPRALDIFLQVLDEGMFADGRGEKVSARNAIIIATSNAGSDLIYENLKKGEAHLAKTQVVDAIIARGIFKPELINRFDDVILFTPIEKDGMRKVVGLMLEKLSKRLREKGIELFITEKLILSLVEIGMDPKFGARALARTIKEKVESVVAEAMLRNNLGVGSRIEIVPDGSLNSGFVVRVR